VDVVSWLDQPFNKVISVVGFRRTGKTFILLDLAQKLGKENCLYLSFEDERLPRETEVLTELVNVAGEIYGRGRRISLLVDEIQEVPQWSRWARRVCEGTNYQVVISGSSSKLSYSGIPTELRGRSISVMVYPLSYSEFLSWKGREANISLLTEYTTYGGFPAIVRAEEGNKPYLFDQYYQTFLLRDIYELHRPRQKAAVRDLIRLLVNSSYFTFGRLQKSLSLAGYKIGTTTVGNYLSWLTDSYFLCPLEAFRPKVKTRLQLPKKPIFADLYILNRLNETLSPNLGRRLELAVAQKLFQQKDLNANMEVYYWKGEGETEVDFVVTNGLTVERLIQVCHLSNLLELPPREIASLVKAAKQLDCRNLTLITWDYTGEIKEKGFTINCLPLGEFLLN
jgi:predicted AAA+ superfamily ATPase